MKLQHRRKLRFRTPQSPSPAGGRGGQLEGVGFLRACLLAALPSRALPPPCGRDARAPSTRNAGNAGVPPAMPTAREKPTPLRRGTKGVRAIQRACPFTVALEINSPCFKDFVPNRCTLIREPAGGGKLSALARRVVSAYALDFRPEQSCARGQPQRVAPTKGRLCTGRPPCLPQFAC